ncbi:MAG: CidA/LrgA family protein [Alphaproteobacteria bacterium]|nr:CidA/LrgA family protein [Alphaproteobacteria bacterium]
MLGFLTLLLVCQLAGEVLVRLAGAPVPGPVVGMALLFAGLAVRGGVPAGLQTLAGGLLQHLSLLFVPAGVGVILHLRLIADEWPAITAALLISTVATIAVTALVMRALSRPDADT